jgi:Zn-dependent peptidase ImmA (M78 family)
MRQAISLDEIQLDGIRRLAAKERQRIGVIGETPIANDLFTILEQKDIVLLEYPVISETDRPAFSAALMHSSEEGQTFVFMGLNTADYFDRQIFAIAHELYHYFTKSGSHLARVDEETDSVVETLANRFAAEFLLPEAVFASIVLNEFRTHTLTGIPVSALMRFIARMQCTWWLPYRSLVKRLYEIGSISNAQYQELYRIDERNMEGEYGRIGSAIDPEVFVKLNTRTMKIGTSAKDIEVVMRNFEDDLIDEDALFKMLAIFQRRPEDFGYSIGGSKADAEELEDFFRQESGDEG